MKATQQLRSEHEGIKVMLLILEQICRQLEANGKLDRDHFDGILEFFIFFVDKCHHGKEEDVLFPALIAVSLSNNGVIDALKREHEMGRNYIKSMSDVYVAYAGDTTLAKVIRENALAYISLLRDHIRKENDVLFVIADSSLSEKMQDEISEGFEKIEKERIGIGKHEEFHNLIEKLGKIYIG